MATPEATTKGNLSSCPVRADGGAPRRRRAPRRGATRSRHTRSLAAAFPRLPAQPRADRIPLPAWTSRLRRLAKAPWAMHYNRSVNLPLSHSIRCWLPLVSSQEPAIWPLLLIAKARQGVVAGPFGLSVL